MNKYFVSIIATDPYGHYEGLAFQAIITIDFDLQKSILECKIDKDFANLWNKVFKQNDVTIWLPDNKKDFIPRRIINFQKISEVEDEVIMD